MRAVIQKAREGLSLKRSVANKAVNSGEIPKTMPPWDEGRSCMAIAMDIGNAKEIRAAIIPSGKRACFFGNGILDISTYMSAAIPAMEAR